MSHPSGKFSNEKFGFIGENILRNSNDKDKIIDDLIDEIFILKEENEKLKDEKNTSKLRYPIKEKKKRWKKLGRKSGHPGSTRKKPDIIDKVEHQTLNVCPDCGSKELRELPSELMEHIQEDIIPAKIETTEILPLSRPIYLSFKVYQ